MAGVLPEESPLMALGVRFRALLKLEQGQSRQDEGLWQPVADLSRLLGAAEGGV